MAGLVSAGPTPDFAPAAARAYTPRGRVFLALQFRSNPWRDARRVSWIRRAAAQCLVTYMCTLDMYARFSMHRILKKTVASLAFVYLYVYK